MTSFKTLKRRQQLQHNKRTRYKPFRIYVRTKHGGRILNKRLSVKVKRGSKTCWARHTAPLLNCSVFQTIGTDPRKYTAHQDHSYDTDSHEIGIDNHASYSMTNNLKDYVGKPRRVRVRVKGIAGRLMSGYVGTVRWRLLDDNGALHILDIPNTYYVPAIPIRLLSPQHLAQQMRRKEKRPDGTFCATFADRATLLWNDRQFIKTIHLNHANVPVFRSAPSYERYGLFEREYNSIAREPKIFATHLIPPDDDDDPIEDEGAEEPTLRPQQQEDEHQLEQSEAISATPSTNEGGNPTQLCFEIPSTTEEDGDQHKLDIPVVEDENTPHLEDPTKDLLIWHYRLGHLPFSRVQAMAKAGDLPKRLASCRIPECAACRFGKATKVPWRVKGKSNSGKIMQATEPGQVVSVDTLESTTPGLIAQLKGRATTNRYRYTTVYVDHASDFSFIYHHKTNTSDEIVQSKRSFEAYAKSLGVRVSHYHADNGRFADNGFIKSVAQEGQTISYCGVNAHFQNGRAEKRIRDLQEQARTQLIHAKHRWHQAVEVCLWPYAVRYFNEVHNNTTRINGGPAPIELFARVNVRPKIRHFHPFACPVYVLNDQLQSNKALPKWESRSRVGLYLGPSPKHARSVALVLNLQTGMASPQYHVRFDNLFETLSRQPSLDIKWQEVCHFREAKRPWNWFNTTKKRRQKPASATAETTHNATEGDNNEGLNQDEIDPYVHQLEQPPAPQPDDDSIPPVDYEAQANTQGEPAPTTHTTRSGRESRAPPWHSDFVAHSARTENEALAQEMYMEEDQLAELDDPILYAMKASSDPDTLYMNEAMREPDANKFKEAMIKEVKDHTERKHWEVMEKKDVPRGETILPAVWAMRRKRRIATREVYKWKSRLNLGGHKMIAGKHYDQTYAPALSWLTIRLFLILTIMNGWKARQIDFVLAYPQADIPRPTFMELPRGINFPGLNRNKHCLRIKKNIYGGKDSGRTWYLHLRKGLESLGFQSTNNDECIFIRGTTVLLIYTDDVIIIDKESDINIDKCIQDLQTIFDVEDEGTLEDYLGVKVTHRSDGTIELTQPQLIDSILADLSLLDMHGNHKGNTTAKDLPAKTTKLIGPDTSGPDFDYDWDYRSVLGKLNFLEKSTRADIAYTVHQCARFTASPKKSHGEAIKYLGRYLLKTRRQGLIIKPDNTKSFECYVDADFCGNWDKNIAAEDPNTAKSRSGFVIKYAGVPIYWSSKMQTQFALSTAESEFLALSAATRHVKSVMYLLEEVNQKFTRVHTKPRVYCKLFEDNSAALEIARVPKLRPRTRHINVIYHHFRNEVANKRLLVLPIATTHQQADFLTKACDRTTFERHRRSVLGW